MDGDHRHSSQLTDSPENVTMASTENPQMSLDLATPSTGGSQQLYPDLNTEEVAEKNVAKVVGSKPEADHVDTVIRSLSVDDSIRFLKSGVKMWKVRKMTRWYPRRYIYDEEHHRLRYEPSRKMACMEGESYIDMCDVKEIRRDWQSDLFNKLSTKIEKMLSKHPNRPPLVEENRCLSIIYGTENQCLDLVASNHEMREMFVRGLEHFLAVARSLEHEQQYENWLRRHFQTADRDSNGCLNFDEILQLLKQLNIGTTKEFARKKFDEFNTNKEHQDGEQVLDQEEFVKFYDNLMFRPELEELLKKYSMQEPRYLTPGELCIFMQNEQLESEITTEDCMELINIYEPADNKDLMTINGFRELLISDRCDIFNPNHKTVFQDMTRPLSHYYVASSHNTYLTGDQLYSDSSVECYIDALKQGCRCVELDCWDGPEGEPVIYHGYTFVSKLMFKDVIDAVQQYAFIASNYPLILSVENHCSIDQQKKLAEHLRKLDNLYRSPPAEDLENLPSPKYLMNKILLKGKKLPTVAQVDGIPQSDSETDEDDDSVDESDKKNNRRPQNLAKDLSDLVQLCQAVRFHSFEDSEKRAKCYQMSSFSESKALSLINESPEEFVNYNKRQLSRIYPSGKRTDSSNYDPIPFWNVGCQIVALNYQTSGKPMSFNNAMFEQNNRCGYVLKPDFLWGTSDRSPILDSSNKKILRIKVLSGQHIPKPKQSLQGEVVDPYVVVKVHGHPEDKAKQKTDSITDNGFNPVWNKLLQLTIRVPEVAFIQFKVKDRNITGKNSTLGYYTIHFNNLMQGYRHIRLLDENCMPILPASLFVHIRISQH